MRTLRSFLVAGLASVALSSCPLLFENAGYQSDPNCSGCCTRDGSQNLFISWRSDTYFGTPYEWLWFQWSSPDGADSLNRLRVSEVEVSGLSDVSVYSAEEPGKLEGTLYAEEAGLIRGQPLPDEDIVIILPIQCKEEADVDPSELLASWRFELAADEVPSPSGRSVSVYGTLVED